MSRKSLQAGYCSNPDDGSCAFEKTECSNVTFFRSSREMQGAPDRAHGGSCLLQESIREKEIGECIPNDNQSQNDSMILCSPNELTCTITNTQTISYNFMDIDTVNHNSKCLIESTLFGSCNDRCSWSPDDCLPTEMWTFPAEECTCDTVLVGACKNNGNLFCAVSKDGCDDKSAWLHPLQVIQETEYECYLCRAKPSSTSSNSNNSSDEISTGSVNKLKDIIEDVTSPSIDMNLILAATLTTVIIICFVVVYTVYVARKRERNSNERLNPSHPPQDVVTVEDNHSSQIKKQDVDDISIL